jgi:NhaP-type Na+/H+ or K+/H+ antiporter
MQNKSGSSVPSFDPDDVGFLILNFIKVFVGSIAIGTACGIITTFLFKTLRFLLDEKGVSEVAMIVLTGYVSYILS